MTADPLPGLKPRGHAQQAHLRVGAGVGPHTPKVPAIFPVFLDPHKGGGLVCKPSRLHDLDALPDVWKRGPHKAGRTLRTDGGDRHSADLGGGHGLVMFHRAAPALFRCSALAIGPRRIRIDHAVPPIR